VKGLEFEYMIIAGANEEYLPLKTVIDEADGEVEKEDTELAERSLLYVAATRARKGLMITSHGRLSTLLAQ
jgi:superfamily I DNA/RNA helicase